ncbi:MAG: ABC transporter permease, partial [Oscillospiraceae bacterium]|nr:ABC transporter permease [Oscillospiraceae bacterium]
MTLKQRCFRVTNLLFLILIAVQFLPDKITKDPQTSYILWFTVCVEALVLIVSAFIKKPQGLSLFLDIVGFLFILLILWTLATAKFNLLKESLFPPPGRVFCQFIEDIDKILINIRSSLGIIVQGYLLAAIIAIPVGLFIGWSVRLGNAATYIAKFLSAIPPIVYI